MIHDMKGAWRLNISSFSVKAVLRRKVNKSALVKQLVHWKGKGKGVKQAFVLTFTLERVYLGELWPKHSWDLHLEIKQAEPLSQHLTKINK